MSDTLTSYFSFLFSYYVKNLFVYLLITYLLFFLLFTFLLQSLFLSLLERLFLREHDKLLSFLLSSFLTFLRVRFLYAVDQRSIVDSGSVGRSRVQERKNCRTVEPNPLPTTWKEMRCSRQDLSQRKRSHRTVRRKKIFPYANHARVVGVDTNILTAFLPSEMEYRIMRLRYISNPLRWCLISLFHSTDISLKKK